MKAPFMPDKSDADVELGWSAGSLCRAPCKLYFSVGAWSVELIQWWKGELRGVAPISGLGIRALNELNPELSRRSTEGLTGLAALHVAAQELSSRSDGGSW
jgi:hypothetical protein